MRVARTRPLVVETVDHFSEVEYGAGGTKDKNVLCDPSTGDLYIAKLGRQDRAGRDSDIEVATEYLIFLAGKSMGAVVADARLGIYRGQLRFMSKVFVRNRDDAELVHGFQLFTEFYAREVLTQHIGSAASEQHVFTVNSIFDAFEAHYMDFGKPVTAHLRHRFVEMLVHDAIIGLVDRHPENWGVVAPRHKTGPAPEFAPLYDSASGLFSEQSEAAFRARMSGERFEPQLAKYIANSRPLIGWSATSETLNHFDLVGRCFRDLPASRKTILGVLDRFDAREFFDRARTLLPILSPFRLDAARCCIRRRMYAIRRALENC